MTIGEQQQAAVATRVDEATGTAERVEFRGAGRERVFSVQYTPATEPVGGLLVCPALASEFTQNYRREVLLARRLAEMGFVVERFHYRFTGNSDGDSANLTFDSMREDAVAATEHLRGLAPGLPLFLLGTRWGSLVAASAAASSDAGLVLGEPELDTARFFKDAFRARLVYDRKRGVEEPLTGAQLIERVRAGDPVEAMGHTIEPELFHSSEGRTLEGELGSTPRAIFVLQLGGTGVVGQALSSQIDRWSEAGFRVDVETVKGDETWWVIDERLNDMGDQPMTKRLIELTSAWLATSVGRQVEA
jgi:alpha/beta superfamily hydrolase